MRIQGMSAADWQREARIAQKQAKIARRAALEEAAKVAETLFPKGGITQAYADGAQIAAAIRKLAE